jgi:5-methyltetrahydrofolate--homocysteine methyltransferase
MVPCEKILEEAVKEKVDIIGLSGLITPSLNEMIHVASEMERRGLNIPLIIGGATTSKLHTAVKIAPERTKAPAIYVPDASKSVTVVSSLLNSDSKDSFISEEYETYEKLRNAHKCRQKKIFSINEARSRKFICDFRKYQPVKPAHFTPLIVESPAVNDLIPFIDWTPFFKVWELKGTYPEILHHPEKKEEAAKIFNDAVEMLKEIGRNKLLAPKGVCGFFRAAAVDDDDIKIFPHNEDGKIFIYNSMREQSPSKPDEPCRALADFIAPENSGITDYIGAFAVTAGHELPFLLKKYRKQFDEYAVIMLKAIADRLAEAFAEYLHMKVRKKYWAYAENENLSNEQLIKEAYQGIRPAPGYPACPDHYGKNIIFELLDVQKHTGITLTESTAMNPAASVCGLYFASPQSHYFYISRIADDQLKNLSERSGRDLDTLRKNFAYLL